MSDTPKAICKNCKHSRIQPFRSYLTYKVCWCTIQSPKKTFDYSTGEQRYKKMVLCRKLNKDGNCEHYESKGREAMSDMEYKTVVRLPLPNLDGLSTTEVLKFFREKIGEPSDVDELDGKVEGFYYEDGEYRPIYDHETKRWAIDKVLAEEDESQEKDPIPMTVHKLANIEANMQIKFGTRNKVFFLSYSWYNGENEPVIIDPNE